MNESNEPENRMLKGLFFIIIGILLGYKNGIASLTMDPVIILIIILVASIAVLLASERSPLIYLFLLAFMTISDGIYLLNWDFRYNPLARLLGMDSIFHRIVFSAVWFGILATLIFFGYCYIKNRKHSVYISMMEFID